MMLLRFVGCFLCLVASFSWSQTIKGTVSDEKTAEKIPFVNVFLNNTSIATETNTEGVYQLKNIPTGSYTLVVRMTGYKPYNQRVAIVQGTNIVVDVKLLVDERLLDEIKIATKRDKTWENQLAIFEKQFLGATESENKCSIVNPWVLDFTNDKGVLKAVTKDILEVNNQKLGYQIRYSLNDFRYDGTQVFFSGYAEFTNLYSGDTRQKTQWEAQRQEAYRGSDIHLFKSLKNKNALKEGFEFFVDKPGEDPTKRSPYFHQIQAKKLSKIVLDSAVSNATNGISQVYIPARIEIHFNQKEGVFSIYKDKVCQVAWIEAKGQPLRFNDQGIILNPQACSVSGYLAENRVANMLPIDYQPAPTQPLAPTQNTPSNAQETPFFSIDRPYYYTHDLIQISGSMFYTNPALADSLSSVLHVELVNPITKQVAVHQRLLIENGLFSTKIVLNDSLVKPQTYLLRVYTQWMRNFSDSAYAYRWLPILKNNESMGAATNPPAAQILKTELLQDSLRVKIPFKSLVWGSLSFIPIQSIGNASFPVYTTFSLPPNIFPKNSLFPIERGIRFGGKIVHYKPTKHANVMLVVPKENLSFFASIDNTGHFLFSDLPIINTPIAILQVMNPKGNLVPAIEIKIDSTASPSWLPKQTVQWKTEVAQLRDSAYFFKNGGIDLQEVKVKATIPPKPIASIYRQADYVLQGKDLYENAIGMNILSALQGRVPGLRIVEFPDGNGLTKLVLTMRMGASSGGFQQGTLPQPLVLVDNVPFENINQIAQIPASQVERVEVVNRAEALTGSRGYVGVISIITKQSSKNGDWANEANLKLESIILNGFAVENNDSKSPFVYDWHPSVSIEAMTGSGVTIAKPKKSGQYRLYFEGLTKDGNLMTAEQWIEIE